MHGYNWITVNFREKYLNIYMGGKPDDAEAAIKREVRAGFTCLHTVSFASVLD
jgi:hypothetical protein